MDGEVGTAGSRRRPGLRASVDAHPKLIVAATLLALAAAAAAIHAVFVGWVHDPRVFMDELGYEQMAQSFARTGHFSLYGKGGLAYSPLYPVVLSPIYALTSSAGTAYRWAKVENAVLFSLSVFPVYAIARSVLPLRRSLGAAALSLLAPLLLYSGFEMSESVSYPLCLVALWAMLRAVRRPSVANDAILLAAIAVASAARAQFVVLIPAALTAILLVALARRDEPEGRKRSLVAAVSGHRLLFGVVAVALVAFVVRWRMNGGNLPLAGRYANVGTSHASPLRVFELFFEHLGELDFAVGVVPFAAALLAGYALVHAGFPRRALIFASVAVATVFWLLLEVAYDAAAFDATSSHLSPGASAAALPRIHERYLIYAMPLFFVALIVALPLFRRKIPTSRHAVIAVVAAALPAVIPFNTIINGTTGIDSFALQMFGTTKHGLPAPIPHATTLIVSLSALCAFAYFLAAIQPFPALAILVTVVALLWLSTLELRGQTTQIASRALGLPAHAGWVDRAVGSNAEVSLVGGDRVQPGSLRQTAFWNDSIDRVYYTCISAFGADFGEQRLAPDDAIETRYAVVPARFHIPGRMLAQDRPGRLVLVAPSGGVLRIPASAPSHLPCRG